MGNLDHVNQLEVYIEELGSEITKVKKASEYLELIQKTQTHLTQTSNTLQQARDQLKIQLELLDSKLEMYQIVIKNIEGKITSIDSSQTNIAQQIAAFNKRYEDMEKSLEIHKQALLTELNQSTQLILEQQKAQLAVQHYSNRFNKIMFATTIALVIIGTLLSLTVK